MMKLKAEFSGNRLHIHAYKCNNELKDILIVDEILSNNPSILIPQRLGFNLTKSILDKLDYIRYHLPLTNDEIIEKFNDPLS
jgi:hypothetical protein